VQLVAQVPAVEAQVQEIEQLVDPVVQALRASGRVTQEPSSITGVLTAAATRPMP